MSEIKNVKRFVISVKGIENKQVCVFVNKKGVEGVSANEQDFG